MNGWIAFNLWPPNRILVCGNSKTVVFGQTDQQSSEEQ
jgi:hypothetical protein